MLSDLDRRVIGNLSIPRNADDLALALRPYAVKTDAEGRANFYTAAEVDTLLRGRLTDLGYVVNLGQHSDPAALASSVQGNPEVMELPDEKAQIYADRLMKRPEFAWRLGGDLWMLSEEGLKAMHAVPDNAPPPMTPQQVQAAIDAEWARVHKAEFVPGETSLANALLEDEFHVWLDAVMSDTKDRWGEMAKDLRGPLAGGASGWTDAYEVSLIDAENQKTALGAVVDPWYMCLSILAFTDADTGTTADNGSHIPTYTGYARKSVAGTDMPAATSGAGSSANTSAIVFAACTAGTSTILAAGNCVASTVGVLRKWFDVASTVVSTTQTPPQFAIGAYTTSAA
jgi:hypothetical protein